MVEGGGGGGFLSITVPTTSFLAPVVFVDSLAKLIKLFKVVLDFGDSTFLLDLLVLGLFLSHSTLFLSCSKLET